MVEPLVTGPVVVGLDGSEESKRALRWAAEYARLSSTPLVAVTAWDVPHSYGFPILFEDYDMAGQARQTLDETIAEVLGKDAEVQARVERGTAAGVLVEASKGASLLVVGSRGHSELGGLLIGSVSQYCVHHAKCPVLVHRG